jgi:hypothetical protein
MSSSRISLVLFGLLGCGLFAPTEREIAIEELEKLPARYIPAVNLSTLRGECVANIKAIKTAQLTYDANFDTYVEVTSFYPDSAPGKTLREFTTGSAFDTIGWMPDGPVRGSYKVTSTSTTDFLITCITDVDGDGVKSSWTATKTLNVTMNTRNDAY